MSKSDLERAQEIAGQPIPDRMDGVQADAAEEMIKRLLVASGLDRMDAIRLLETYGWSRFNRGFQGAKEAFTAADRGMKAAGL